MLVFQNEPVLAVEEYIAVLKTSTLSERRPVEDIEHMATVLQNSNLVITARENGMIVGISRCVTDFSCCCYVADLAVSASHQKQGIGRSLMEETKKHLKPGVTIILLSAPKAMNYYPKIGFRNVNNAFTSSVE